MTKVVAILVTLLCMAGFGGLFNWVFGSLGLSDSFRYKFLVRLTVVASGTVVSFAAFTVALKWILAGASIIPSKGCIYKTNLIINNVLSRGRGTR